jgi:hypothetical protein
MEPTYSILFYNYTKSHQIPPFIPIIEVNIISELKKYTDTKL